MALKKASALWSAAGLVPVVEEVRDRFFLDLGIAGQRKEREQKGMDRGGAHC